jgi:adenosine deaminase
MNRSWEPQPQPTQTKRNFVRTGAKRGQVVYEQPPTGSNSHSFTGYTGVAADHLRRHAENKPKRATQSNAQERARQYEQQQEEARERDIVKNKNVRDGGMNNNEANHHLKNDLHHLHHQNHLRGLNAILDLNPLTVRHLKNIL